MDSVITFYNVKTKAFVEVPVGQVIRKIYKRETSKGVQNRYAVRAQVDGMMLTKFVSKATFDGLSGEIEE